MLDCGEGTTQKLIQLKKIEGIKRIYFSHLHCDHFTGLFSLLWYYGINIREQTLTILGPSEIEHATEQILKLLHTPDTLRTFPIEYIKLDDTEEIQQIKGVYDVKCVKTQHDPITFGYRIEEGGKTLCYTSDTAPTKRLEELAENSHLLITESTLPQSMHKLAHQINHSTPKDAISLATKAKCDRLVLFHLSPTYFEEIKNSVKEYRQNFAGEILIARDLMTLEI